FGEPGRCEVIIDAPPGVVVEGLTPRRPPGVGTIDLAVETPADIDPAQARADGAVDAGHVDARCAEKTVEIGALAGQETGFLAVAAPVLDVELAVADVEVTGDDGEGIIFAQLLQTRAEGIEKLPL